MEDFIATQLHAVETCCICTDAFDKTHHPVALPCKHIVGHPCITRWLREGRGNTSSCPHCRRQLFTPTPTPENRLRTSMIWKCLLEQTPERLHAFMLRMLLGLQKLWQRKADGNFFVTEILEDVVFPALQQTAIPEEDREHGENDVFADSYELIATCWDAAYRPERAFGLAIPFVRLARLMSSVSSVLPKWLTSSPEITKLVWAANACLFMEDKNVSWDMIALAVKQESEHHFPLLHLYTVLISQSVQSNSAQWPLRRHEVMNLTVERCCTKIGGRHWSGRPSNEFKDLLVCVYGELRRHQLEMNRPSLRGHKEQQHVVHGLWAMAAWGAAK